MAKLMKLVRNNIIPNKVDIEDIENAELIAEYDWYVDALRELRKYKNKWSDSRRLEIMLAPEDSIPVERAEQYFVVDAADVIYMAESERYTEGALGEIDRMIGGETTVCWRGLSLDTLEALLDVSDVWGIDFAALARGQRAEIENAPDGDMEQFENKIYSSMMASMRLWDTIDAKERAEKIINAVNKAFGLNLR